MFKIRTKLVLISTALFSTILLSLAGYGFYDFWNTLKEIHKARIGRHMDKVLSEFQQHKDTSGFFDLSFSRSIPLVDLDSIFYQVYDEHFNLCSAPQRIFTDPSFQTNLHTGRNLLLIEYNRRHFFCIFSSVIINDRLYYVAAAAVSRITEEHYFKHKFWLLFAVPLYILLILGVSYFMAGLSLKPISRIISAVKNLTTTNLHARLEVHKSKDELRELAETLNGMIERLAQSFESQKTFIANASHEMKTPLAVLSSRLELLHDEVTVPEQREEIKQLLEEVDRLSALARSLLILARLDSDSGPEIKQIVRLDEILIEAIRKFTPQASTKNIQLMFNLDEIFEITGDSARLKTAIENLLDNAIKYSFENKNISICLSGKNNGMAYIEIKDSGCGIPENDKPRIFDRFYRSNTTRRQFPGSGLGLSIAREIILQHHGTIEFESTENIGTTFTIIIPI